MNILKKVKVLGEAASYDTVCGSPRSTKMSNTSLVDTVSSCIHKSRTENYDCKIFKVLMSNKCSHDCKYCTNRCSKQKNITAFKPFELASLFNAIRRKGLCNSLFLSSGVSYDADIITEKMIETVSILRRKFNFFGFVHFKILPGTSKELVKQASSLAHRMSINIEAPNKDRISSICSTKDLNNDIKKRQRWIKELKPIGGQTTQLIVGAAGESDKEILNTVDDEIKRFNLRRFYFSAFSPIKDTPFENKSRTPLLREHRLYNVEFMVREYGFNVKDFNMILDKDNNLPRTDPKVALANELLDSPVDINEADYELLLKIPGIGINTAKKILYIRKKRKFRKYEELNNLGVSIKRAKPYINVDGKVQKRLSSFA